MNTFELIIFGGDGDLSFRKIYPALYYRLADNQITDNDRILALSRSKYSNQEFKQKLINELNEHLVKPSKSILDKLVSMIEHGSVDTDAEKQSKEVEDWFNKSKSRSKVFLFSDTSCGFWFYMYLFKCLWL